MNAILSVLFSEILPVFALMALGYGFAKAGKFDQAQGGALNRYVFYIGVPALLVSIISQADLGAIRVVLLANYLATELLMIAIAMLIFIYGFKRPWRESMLMGMATAFVNHVLYVRPIATNIYGDAATLPIIGIIILDSVIVFAGIIIILESARTRNPVHFARLLITNPMLAAIAIGLIINFSQWTMPDGLQIYLDFAGGAAAPVSLFVLGITLAHAKAWVLDKAAIIISASKLLLQPILLFGFLWIWGVEIDHWSRTTMLVAAGPCGAMAYVLAMQYGVPVASIARAILYTSIGSLLSLAIIA